mmetsp:Transcript_18392/g.37468  ORF Transcript_18392/g.37468 Transcript_18392/m.37468 type:complete len:95 (-) Transcript_18392:151-435(-)
MVHLEVDPDQIDQFMEVAAEDSRGTRAEPGCVRFDVLRDQKADNKFIFIEVYRDAEAIAAHKLTPHYKMWSEFKAQEPKPIVKQEVIKSDLLLL